MSCSCLPIIHVDSASMKESVFSKEKWEIIFKIFENEQQ